ncbi:hypothetical protein F1880_009325 [Penicillium rolfsii]|nr:hypothetical protein F1880_009325 [Penicillium rolfsii]
MATTNDINYEQEMILSKEWSFATNPANWDDEQELRRMVALEGIDDAPRLKGFKKRVPISITPETILAGPGSLSKLPLELLFRVIGVLDVDSAEAFGQTSRLARFMLEQHPSYKPLMQIIIALRVFYRNSGTDRWETLDDLTREMHHPYCRACGHQGTLLFLPLAERVCYNCSTHSPAYWCIAIPNAMAAFCISEKQVRKLHVMKIHETKWRQAAFPIARTECRELVPAKSAFLAAVKAWGNRKTMCRYARSNDPDPYPDSFPEEVWLGSAYRFMRNMQTKTPDDPTQLEGPHIFMTPEYNQITAVPFPWIPKGKTEIERRFMCRGCEYLSRQPEVSRVLLEYSGIKPTLPDRRVKKMLLGRRDTAHTWNELMSHVRGCAGAGILMFNRMVERDFEHGLGHAHFWTWP